MLKDSRRIALRAQGRVNWTAGSKDDDVVTEQLFREDSYLKECDAVVVRTEPAAIILDRSVFYPLGGGQPGDTGWIRWGGGSVDVVDTRYGENGEICHLVADGSALPDQGTPVTAVLDWERRYLHMRMHSGLHLLGSVLQFGVTGGNISAQKSRLDFDMEDPVDKQQVNDALRALVDANHEIRHRWISDADLDAQPELVRTMSVKPPRGAGQIRLLEIEGVDLQPCGGTHLRCTAEVGRISLGKVEKKGKHNRRVYVQLDAD
jgi:misacylated tRNA(Ala) deacylase